jgi:hypothetical protein
MAVCQVMSILPGDEGTNGTPPQTEKLFCCISDPTLLYVRKTVVEVLPFGAQAPMWYLRLAHTRLSDDILDICGVPQKELIRRTCLRLLTQFTAPPPSKLSRHLPMQRKRSNSRYAFKNPKERLTASLENATENLGLPHSAAGSLRAFILCGCFPLPTRIAEALEAVQASLLRLRQSLGKSIDPKRARRFDDAGKSLNHLVNLTQLLSSIGIGPLLGSKDPPGPLSRPIFISLDLGLRQRRANYHGLTLFQCISLRNNYFEDMDNDNDEPETNDTIISSSGPGLKVAEGGRYDDLVRRYRPPGNFGNSMLDQYTTAPIPKVSLLLDGFHDNQSPKLTPDSSASVSDLPLEHLYS